MKKFTTLADKVMALEDEYSKLTDTELQNKTEEFKNRLRDGETLLIFLWLLQTTMLFLFMDDTIGAVFLRDAFGIRSGCVLCR